MSIADSGATSHFVTIDAPIINCKVTNDPLAITTANGESMYSTHTAELNIPYLPFAARLCHVVPKLGQYSLVSIGQLCNADCDVLFQRESMTVSYKSAVLYRAGGRDPPDCGILTSVTITVAKIVVSPGPWMLIPESNQSQETFHLIESIPNHEHQNTKHPNSNLV
jgi:hypothetical protein